MVMLINVVVARKLQRKQADSAGRAGANSFWQHKQPDRPPVLGERFYASVGQPVGLFSVSDKKQKQSNGMELDVFFVGYFGLLIFTRSEQPMNDVRTVYTYNCTDTVQ